VLIFKLFPTTSHFVVQHKKKREMKYQLYTAQNFRSLPQIDRLSAEQIFDIEVVSKVLPFKTNNYVMDQLVDWDNFMSDPLFRLTIPQKGMLKPDHFDVIADLVKKGVGRSEIMKAAQEIRLTLNPHPAGQLDHNVPDLDGDRLMGLQHKYSETMLFFPTQGQTCHAYCTFCFRWPQFTGMGDYRFAMNQADLLVKYLQRNPQITDILITGGDPMVMKAQHLDTYISALLKAGLDHLTSIRIGTKALSFWPYRFINDPDTYDILKIFSKVQAAGKHLAIMAHFNHPNELKTEAVRQAITKIRSTGAQIRTQSPLLKHINDDSAAWSEMWLEQIRLGLIPYYMFVARNTGAQDYFAIPLAKAYEIYSAAYKNLSGLGRTVRGPSMSANPGKVAIDGITEINGEKVFVLDFIQGRSSDWVNKPFFAKFDPKAIWLDDLVPAFGEKEFFYEAEFKSITG